MRNRVGFDTANNRGSGSGDNVADVGTSPALQGLTTGEETVGGSRWMSRGAVKVREGRASAPFAVMGVEDGGR